LEVKSVTPLFKLKYHSINGMFVSFTINGTFDNLSYDDLHHAYS
ncbi:16091_t:CDS:1, partial [Gigaspora rosea]